MVWSVVVWSLRVHKSVYFKSYVGIIDKYNDIWYVVGNKVQSSKNIKNSINCNTVGTFIEGRCVIAINRNGNFIDANSESLNQINRKNILYPVGIKDWGFTPKPFDGTKLTWNEKNLLKSEQSKRFFDLGKPLFTGEIK